MEYQFNRKKKNEQSKTVLKEYEKNGVLYLSFPSLEHTELVDQAFSTKIGGVSQGCFSTMNFSFMRGDVKEDVLTNYQRMADVLGVDRDRMVLTFQTHTVNVRKVTEEDAGKGVICERDYRDVDGLITDVPGMTLVTFFADCVPLYFVDPVHKAIGLSHSGWRGTVNRMGKITIEAMGREYGTKPEDLIACVGPSICRDCYEIGTDVAEQFEAAFDKKNIEEFLFEKGEGKYLLDLWKANEIILKEAGIREENLSVTDICTCCNEKLLFSHRKHGESRGNLCAFLSLKEL